MLKWCVTCAIHHKRLSFVQQGAPSNWLCHLYCLSHVDQELCYPDIKPVDYVILHRTKIKNLSPFCLGTLKNHTSVIATFVTLPYGHFFAFLWLFRVTDQLVNVRGMYGHSRLILWQHFDLSNAQNVAEIRQILWSWSKRILVCRTVITNREVPLFSKIIFKKGAGICDFVSLLLKLANTCEA